jgi:ATP-dependent RNA helicase DDX19/DBP5
MLKTEELSVEGIKQFYMDCTSEQQKFEVLVQIYSLLTVGQSIIFVQVCPLPTLKLLATETPI